MTRRDPLLPLRHMLDYAREARAFTLGRTRADLDADRMLSLALVHVVEVIGEAARRASPEVRARLPGIPWPQLVSTRNRLIHGYDTINFDTLWDIITSELPPLITELEHALATWDERERTGDTP